MERVKKAGANLANGYWGERIGSDEVPEAVTDTAEDIVMTTHGLDKNITIDDLRKHDKADEPWFVVNGEVYDGTPFLKEHPGGAQSIVSAAGLDSTDEFMAIRKFTT